MVRAKNAYAKGEKIGPAALDRMLTEARAVTPWLREGSSVPQQQLVRDFGKARAKAIKDIKDRLPMHRRAGMPKGKRKRKALPTLNYTKRGFRLKDGKLHLAGGIILTVVWSRALPSDPTSVRVYQDSLGQWYCSFVVPACVQPLPETGCVIGIDWGVKETATTTSARHDLPHPAHGRKAEEKLSRYDRMMARRKPKKGQASSKGFRDANASASNCTRRLPDSARTQVVSGPRESFSITTPLRSKTSNRDSLRRPRWPARPLTPPSAPPRRP